MGGGSSGGCSSRQSLVVQPESLAGHVMYSTPLGAKSMRLAGRGALADEGTVYTSKVSELAEGRARGQLCKRVGLKGSMLTRN